MTARMGGGAKKVMIQTLLEIYQHVLLQSLSWAESTSFVSCLSTDFAAGTLKPQQVQGQISLAKDRSCFMPVRNNVYGWDLFSIDSKNKYQLHRKITRRSSSK